MWIDIKEIADNGYKLDTVQTYLRRLQKKTHKYDEFIYREKSSNNKRTIKISVWEDSELYELLEQKYPYRPHLPEIEQIKYVLKDFNYPTKDIVETVRDICQRLDDILNEQEDYIERRLDELIEEYKEEKKEK